MPRRKHILNVRFLVAIVVGLVFLAGTVHGVHLYQLQRSVKRREANIAAAAKNGDLRSEQKHLTRYLQLRPDDLDRMARRAIVRDELATATEPDKIVRSQLELSNVLRLDDYDPNPSDSDDSGDSSEAETKPISSWMDVFDLRRRLARAHFALGQIDDALAILGASEQLANHRREGETRAGESGGATAETATRLVDAPEPASEPPSGDDEAARKTAVRSLRLLALSRRFPADFKAFDAELWRLSARCYVARAELAAAPRQRTASLADAVAAYRKAIQSDPTDTSGYDPYGLLDFRDPSQFAEMTVYEEAASVIGLAAQSDATKDADELIDQMIKSNGDSIKAQLAAYRYYRDHLEPEAREKRQGALQRALEISPENHEVLLASVEEDLQAASEMDADPREAAYADVERRIELGLEEFPEEWRFRVWQVRLLLAREHTDQAKTAAQAAIARLEEAMDDLAAASSGRRTPTDTSERRDLESRKRALAIEKRDLETALAEAFLRQRIPDAAEQILLPSSTSEQPRPNLIDPAVAKQRSLLGRALAHQGKYAQAVRALEALTGAPLGNSVAARVQYYLGFCYERMQQPDVAIAHYASAADVPGARNGADEPLPHLALARLHLNAGQPDDARRWMTRALEKLPSSAREQMAALRVEYDLQKRNTAPPAPEAQRLFHQMVVDELKLGETTPAMLRLKATYFAAFGHIDDAIRFTEQAATNAELKSATDLITLAQLHGRKQDEARAEAYLREAVEQFPDDSRPRAALARALAADGRIDEAERLLTKDVESATPAMREALLEAWGRLAVDHTAAQEEQMRNAAAEALGALDELAGAAPDTLARRIRELAQAIEREDLVQVQRLSKEIRQDWTSQGDATEPAPGTAVDLACQAWMVLAQDDPSPDELASAKQKLDEVLPQSGAARPLLNQVAKQLGAEQLRRAMRGKAKMALEQWAEMAPEALAPRVQLVELAIDENDTSAVRGFSETIRNGGWTWPDEDGRMVGPGACYHLFCSAWLDIAERKDDLSSARKHLDQLRRQRPQWEPALRLAGMLEEAEGNTDAAIEAYQAQLELPGFDRVAAERLIYLLTQHRPEALRQVAQRIQAKRGNNQGALAMGTFGRLGLAASLVGTSPARVDELVEPTTRSRDPRALMYAAVILWQNGDREGAEKALTRAQDLDNQLPDAYISLAVFYMFTGRQAEASKVLAEAKQNLAEAHRFYAVARLNQLIGQYVQADTARARSQGWTERADVFRQRAAVAYRNGLAQYPNELRLLDAASRFFFVDPAEAKYTEDLLERTLRIYTETGDEAAQVRVRRLLALTIARDGNRRDEVDKLIDRNLDGGLAEARPADLRTKAVLLAARNTDDNRRTAIELLEALARRRSETTPADRFLLARLYYSESEPRKGRDQMLPLLTSNKTSPAEMSEYLTFFVNVLLRGNELAQADRWLGELENLELNNKAASANAQAPRLRALLLVHQGKEREALDHLEAILLPGVDEALRVRVLDTAVEVLMIGDPEQGDFANLRRVERWVDAALKDDPDNVHVQVVQGNLWILREQDCHKAYKVFQEVLDRGAKEPLPRRLRLVALNNIAWILSERLTGQLDRRNEPLKYIELAIREFGAVADLIDTRAVVLTRLGRNVELAIQDLEFTIARDPRPIFYYHLAQAYEVAGDTKKAQTALENAQKAGAPERIPFTERAAYRDFESRMGARASR